MCRSMRSCCLSAQLERADAVWHAFECCAVSCIPRVCQDKVAYFRTKSHTSGRGVLAASVGSVTLVSLVAASAGVACRGCMPVSCTCGRVCVVCASCCKRTAAGCGAVLYYIYSLYCSSVGLLANRVAAACYLLVKACSLRCCPS